MKQIQLRLLGGILAIFVLCEAQPLEAQSLGDVLKGALKDYARTKVSEAEAKTGIALNPSGVPIVLEDAIRSAEYDGWTKAGGVQVGFVIEGEGATAAVARELMSVLNIQWSGGETLRVLASCPGCTSFRLSDGDDGALSSIGSLDIPYSAAGKVTVPITKAVCRPGGSCQWYAQVLRKK